jgi:hypothetical protein
MDKWAFSLQAVIYRQRFIPEAGTKVLIPEPYHTIRIAKAENFFAANEVGEELLREEFPYEEGYRDQSKKLTSVE